MPQDTWIVKNQTTRYLSVGDLPKLPALWPGKVINVLNYYEQDAVSNSASLKDMLNRGWLTITKTKNGTSTKYDNTTDSDEAITTAERKDAIDLDARVDALESGVGGAVTAGSNVIVDNTSFNALSGTNSQDLWEENDTALLNARSTGIRSGGNLTDQGLGVVRIASGVGEILNNSIPSNPIFSAVTWSQSDLDLSAADGIYYIYVNNTGTVTSTITIPTPDDYRLNIWLWRVSIRSGIVSGTAAIPQPLQQYSAQIWDIWRALGYVKTGLVPEAASTDLSIEISNGGVYLPGANYYNDPINPHQLIVAASSPVTFRHINQLNVQSADRTQLDVTNYDLNGTITPIPGAAIRAQIFTWAYFPTSDNHRIFYGQEFFASVDAAQTALFNGTYQFSAPASYANAVTVGWIITQAGATDLSDGIQTFVTSNKFGGVGGALATSGATPLLAINNLSDVENIITARTNLGAIADILEDTTPQLGGNLDLNGNNIIGYNVTTITSTSYSATSSNNIMLVDDDTAGSTVTITLPAAASNSGLRYEIKKIGSTANVIVDGNGSEAIDGQLTATLSSQYDSISLVTDGSNWYIL